MYNVSQTRKLEDVRYKNAKRLLDTIKINYMSEYE